MRARCLSLSLAAHRRGAHLAQQRRHLAGEVAPAGGRLTDLSGLGPKRFYKTVDVEHDAAAGFYAVTIDGRRVRTPRRSILQAPTEALAVALATEWDAQGARIRPSSMPLTALVSTAHDIVPEFRGRITSSILRYLDSDALCIRPDAPDSLVEAQSALFDPIAAHLKRARNLDLNVRIGGLSADQPPRVRRAVEDLVHSLGDLTLAALDSAAATCKSVTIALALYDGGIDADRAAAAARSEEGWQERRWGTVEGGHDLDAADVLVRLAAADAVFRFVDLAPSKFPRRVRAAGAP
jgi:ATP synthase mitochondrial F1 complex assembly factor 2